MIVHVGQPKAASTSLQDALAAHSARLASAGVRYPVVAGRRNHVAEANDFILGRAGLSYPVGGRTLTTLNQRAKDPGGWDRLVAATDAAVAGGDRVIVSAEDLSTLSPMLANQVLRDLTGGRPDRAAVVLVLRSLSTALPSLYAQGALIDPMPRFEVSARLTLLGLLRPDPRRGFALWLDADWLRSTWSGAGEMRVVAYDSPTLDHDLLEALELGSVLDAPFLGRSNVGVGAAWSIAWQDHRRVVGWHDDRSALIREVKGCVAAHPVAAGTFALVPEVATVVDRAFPIRPEAVAPGSRQEARERLDRMLRGAAAITRVEGIDAPALDTAVAQCRAWLAAPGRPGEAT